MATKQPITRVKPVTAFLSTLVTRSVAIDSNKDGIIQFMEWLNLLQVTAIDAFKQFVGFDFKEFALQLRDIDPAERKELLDVFKTNFQLNDTEAEFLLEMWLDWLERGVSLYEFTRAYFEKRKAAQFSQSEPMVIETT